MTAMVFCKECAYHRRGSHDYNGGHYCAVMPKDAHDYYKSWVAHVDCSARNKDNNCPYYKKRLPFWKRAWGRVTGKER